jgi:tetratricopeptide (TPR) repeat protein
VREPDAPFERAFSDLVLPELPGAGKPAPAGLPPGSEGRLREALALFAEGHYARSAEALGQLGACAGGDPRAAALGAAHGAFATGRLQPAIQECLALLQEHPQLPDLYAVLGVLLLKAKQRAQAHAAFRSGLALAPHHPGLLARLEEMGPRRAPLLRFLPRAHPANRWLGRVRAWLGGRRDPLLSP